MGRIYQTKITINQDLNHSEMHGYHTSSVRYKSNLFQYIIAIFIGYTVGGFYLSSCQANIVVWTIVSVLVAYTALTGKNGIILSSLCFSSILTIYTLANPWPLLGNAFLPLNSAKLWSLALLSSWVLGVLLLCLLGFAVTVFTNQRWSKWQYAACFSCLSWVSLGLGRSIFGHLISLLT